MISRRELLALASVPLAGATHIPIGLELYSVREDLKKDSNSTVRAVAKMGYEDVEFYAPYFDWTVEDAKQMRKLLDEAGIRCLSTHNGTKSFTADGLQHAIDLNLALGSRFIVMASAGKLETLDAWKGVAENLSTAAERLKSHGLRTGYHNHQLEFRPINGTRPMEVIAAGTPKSVMLQLDVGTCVEAGSDPVAWIEQNPGRINSLHCKDWSPEKGYEVLIGEGAVPWKKLLHAAQTVGGVEFYLVEQEGSRYSPTETAERCLAAFKKIVASA